MRLTAASPHAQPPVDARHSRRRWNVVAREEPRAGGVYRFAALALGTLVGFEVAAHSASIGAGAFIDQIWTSTFGSTFGLTNLLTICGPLVLVGLAASIPQRVGWWNIGGDGQMQLGAWAATGVALELSGMSGHVLIVLMMISAIIAGAAWVALAAFARAFLGVNEIITTLLLNFIAGYWLLYWAGGPWLDPQSSGGVVAKPIPDSTNLSTVMVGDTPVPVGFLIAVAAAVILWAVFRFTRVGYEVSILGPAPRVASYAGVSARRLAITLMALGGGMAGLAGAIVLMGSVYQYGTGITSGTGYVGVVIAVIAARSELNVVVVAVIFGVITVMGQVAQVAGASADVVLVMLGVTLTFAAIGQGLSHFEVRRLRPIEATPVTGGDASVV